MLWLGLGFVVLFCSINMLGESLDGGNRSSGLNHPYSTFVFLLSSKPTNLSSSGPQSLLVSVAVPSVSKVARRPGKEVGRMASPFRGARQGSRPGWAECPRPRAPMLLAQGYPGALAPGEPESPPTLRWRRRTRPGLLDPRWLAGSSCPCARPSAWLLAWPGAGRGSSGGGGERVGSHLEAQVPPRRRRRWRRRGGSDTCVARSRTAVGSAVGQLQTRRGRCWEALREEEAAECGRRGWGGAEGETGVGRERSGQSRVAACAPSALHHRFPGQRSGPRAVRAAA